MGETALGKSSIPLELVRLRKFKRKCSLYCNERSRFFRRFWPQPHPQSSPTATIQWWLFFLCWFDHRWLPFFPRAIFIGVVASTRNVRLPSPILASPDDRSGDSEDDPGLLCLPGLSGSKKKVFLARLRKGCVRKTLLTFRREKKGKLSTFKGTLS